MTVACRLLGATLCVLSRNSFATKISGPPTFGDVNLLIITDAHSWIAGHNHDDHNPMLNAGYGEIASAVAHVKDMAATDGKDVFFVNNGDHVEGSGLSDASMYLPPYIHGFNLFPLIQLMPFDALTIGNHDVYDDSTVTFMQESGFVESWGGRYLTSNTRNASTGKTIGSKYTVLSGPNSGVKIMLFGFLYHMTDSCDTVVVEDPAQVVKEAWFTAALDDALKQDIDSLVILSHMDLEDRNVGVIQAAIRGHSNAAAELPLVFVTGHTHYRGFNKIDSFGSSFEAGHYLDTLGWISFNLNPTSPAENGTAVADDIYFDFSYVDANMEVLYDFTNTTADTFDTDSGLGIRTAIDGAVAELGLREVLGCPTQNYSYTAALGAQDSLYDLYMDVIVPNAVFDIPTGTGLVPYQLTSTGTLRYDIYAPTFYYDDVFAIAPFSNVFLYFSRLSGSELLEVSDAVGGGSERVQTVRNPLKWEQESTMPAFIGGPGPVNTSTTYDLFFSDYDESAIVGAIAAVRGVSKEDVTAALVPWRSDRESEDFVDTTLCWSKNVADLWPC